MKISLQQQEQGRHGEQQGEQHASMSRGRSLGSTSKCSMSRSGGSGGGGGSRTKAISGSSNNAAQHYQLVVHAHKYSSSSKVPP